MVQWKKLLVLFALLSLGSGLGSSLVGVTASDGAELVPEPFRGETQGSKLSINYGDYSAILKQTVLRAGHSNRVAAVKAAPAAGSRISRGSKKPTRLEGNRIDFYAFVGENQKIIFGLRDDIAGVASVLPLRDLSRDEQLAYWLNLYNITLMGQVSKIFPESSLGKYYKGKKKKAKLWDEKVVTVAGISLSLNDMQHKIIIPKFKNPLVMYGMFQGVIGGPNIRREAFTGREVWDQLQLNAREFVNSNRGARVRYKALNVSELYKINAALFPNFEADVRKHIHHFSKPDFKRKITPSLPVKASQKNWDIADVYGGSKALGSAVSTNAAALLNAFETGSGAGAAGDYGGGEGGAIMSAWVATMESMNMNRTRFPSHVVDYLHKKELRDRKLREGSVEIEEQPNKNEEKEDPTSGS